uniref:Serine palmitoyltransferase 1 n=1 Tax=Phallusia mammillata TaxID=59560 RepID=A0A6F9DU45_9ASCI|nr:serine palmitoyltransferase 1 [Phallusia mammillata]
MDQPRQWIFAEAFNSVFQAPPYHLILEAILIVWIIRLLFFKSYKLHGHQPLTDKEKDDLVNEWKPEPLVPPLAETISSADPYRLVTGSPGKTIVVDGNECLNFATMNFLGLLGNPGIGEKSSSCIKHYGVGSCGPRAFYGTVDVHEELEDRLAQYMKSERAVSYSYGFATIASAIPSYAKRGDIIFADEAVCFAIQKGLLASRSHVVYFKHNDIADLEDKLKAQEKLDKKNPKKASVTRKFIVVEGIYMNTGQLCDLPKLVELKYKYKVRLFVDESLSFGVLGDNGRGVTEHFDIPIDKVDLVVGSLEYSLASVGGFCCGRAYVVDHQRLSGQGYVFSASLPPLLARAAIEALNIVEEDPGCFARLREKARRMQELLSGLKSLKISGYVDSPSFHLVRRNPVNYAEDILLLKAIVAQCTEKGVCIVVSSRLKHEEANSNWPPSIRIAVTASMDDCELVKAANVIKQVVDDIDSN